MICENSNINSHTILNPTCYNSKANYIVTIQYSKEYITIPDIDVLYLCKECKDNIKIDAENHGYGVSSEVI